MDLFPHDIKLYHMWDEECVRFSLKSSPSMVLTFYFKVTDFQKMIKDCYEPGGYEENDLFVFVKKDYVRFSHCRGPYTTHFRLDRDKWRQMIEDYHDKLQQRQGDYFSCIVT